MRVSNSDGARGRPRVFLVRLDRDRIFTAVANERRQIATLIEASDPAQLATPSLCSGWDVKTVAAHLACSVTDGLSGTMKDGFAPRQPGRRDR